MPAGSRVSDIALSPAQPLLAVLSTKGNSILWDLTDKTGKAYATFALQKEELGGEFDWNQKTIQFDADGKKLLTLELDGSAAIWDVKGKAQIPLAEVGKDMSGIAFNQSGNSFASMNTDGTFSVWQADTKAELFWQRLKGNVTRLIFCHGDKYIAVLSDEDDVKLYDSQSGELVAQVPNDAEGYDIAASPDSRFLATADANGMARVWEIHTDGTVANLLHTDEVEQLMLSGNGQQLVSKSRDGFAHIWDPTTGQEVYAWQDLGLFELTPDQDASRLYHTYIDSLSSGRFALRAHDRLSKKTAYTLLYASDYLLHFAPAVGIAQRAEVFAEVKPPPTGYLNILSQSYQETAPLVYMDSTALPSSVVKSVHILPGLDHLRNTDTLMPGGYFLEGPVAVSSDGRMVAVMAENNIYLCDANTGRTIAHLPHGYEVYTGTAQENIFTDMAVPVYCQFSGDGRYLVSLTNNNVLRIWDTGQKQYTLPILLRQEMNLALPHLRAKHTYASLPADNPYLLVIEDTNRVALMDFPSLSAKHSLTTKGKFEFFSFGADNRLLATVSFSKLNSNEEVAGNADSFIEIWNTTTAERLRLITVNDPVHYTAFSPDGLHLVTAGRNGQARVWNLETGREVSRIVHKGPVQKAFFAMDGKILVTTTGPTGKNMLEPHSQEVKLSHWQKNDLVTTLSSKLMRNLSEQEWEQYFPGEEYRKTSGVLP
jgi:WD40 repeat protein